MNISKKLALGAILACATWASTTMAATETEKLNAINSGLNRLFLDQQAGGYWNYGGYEQAATGAVVTAFLSQKTLWGANTAAYTNTVNKAVAYLLANASIHSISTRAGNGSVNVCPGGSGSCNGIYWYGAGRSTYSTGQIVPALMTYASGLGATVATTTGPLAGLTWSQIAQGIANQWAQSQTGSDGGWAQGGWHYWDGDSYDASADGSTTQWGVLSLIYATNYGATIPAFVKSDLAFWVAADHDGSGAGCYTPGSLCDHSDTGALLLGLKFIGKPVTDTAVVNAINWLNSNWSATINSTWYGNFGHPYAMYGVYKGLEVNIGLTDTTHITPVSAPNGCQRTGAGHLPGSPSGSTACNWWQDYNDWLVKNQNANGSWTGDGSTWYGPLATAYDISILAAQRVSIGLCDANSDGFINTTDLAIISAARGQHATGTNDPRDGDGDLMITPNDVKVCITKQTH